MTLKIYGSFLRVWSVLYYSVNSALQAWHLPFSIPVTPIIKILPIVPHFGHRPVVTFRGPLTFGFTVFLLTNIPESYLRIIKSKCLDRKKRGEWDSNPRVLADMGLAIPRPTRLGDPRTQVLKLQLLINLAYQSRIEY